MKSKKVLIAMSGGVDSSVSAALLKEQGFDVVSVFMLLGRGLTDENLCCSWDARKSAEMVAKKLGIKFYTVDFKDYFEQEIINSFIADYANSLTPNPCIRCNQLIKFDRLWQYAKKLKCDYIATGHYARIKHDKSGYHLLKGKDKNKDQSYFLCRVQSKQLLHLMFPVGHLTKPQVRRLAAKFNLPTAQRRESQEVCFVPRGGLADFLKQHIESEPGKIKDFQSGQDLGLHDGLSQFTIGQRKGIGLASGPYYVIKMDKKNNVLWVSKNKTDLLSKTAKLVKLSWISHVPKLPLACQVKIRYLAKPASAILRKKGSACELEFKTRQRAVTPGQVAVFYQGQEVIGCGIIR